MAAVARLILQDFRSYEALDLPVEGQIVALIGENGAGKTNILEALSLFTPGRGLRRAELSTMARQGGGGSFATPGAEYAAFLVQRVAIGAVVERVGGQRHRAAINMLACHHFQPSALPAACM